MLGIHGPDPLVKGAVKGAGASLYNWTVFAGNVGTGDKATLKK